VTAATNDPESHEASAASSAPLGEGKPVSRRAVLRGSLVTVPTILTLSSGSALALSSNLIGVNPAAEPVVGENFACLDVSPTSTVMPVSGRPNVYDLGNPVNADLTAIPVNRDFYRGQDESNPVTGPQMCAEGGTFYYKKTEADGIETWPAVQIKQGVLCSATALASFTGKIRIHQIY
jgi:hypothetical protein